MSSFDQTVGDGCLVLDSPHSGHDYPDDFDHACPRLALRQAEDNHVERLFDFAPSLGASLVLARFPRSYIDPNRAADDIDTRMLDAPWPGTARPSAKVHLGKGLIWRMLDDGTPIYARSLGVAEVQARIDRCWRPYHQAVHTALQAARRRHAAVLHLNCHSMPASSAAFSSDFPGLVHADFVLGDRDGSSAAPALTAWIAAWLRAKGFTVSVNHPYKGVELVRLHGQPHDGQHAIQFEVNKRLYMDEASLAPHDGFAGLRAVLYELLQALPAQVSTLGARATHGQSLAH
ncbi:MAG: N-formylglutamate amidohydrolase [Rubrivivax sp.]|nr:N-formylglutamate amidohydrolase [Rubrivivax sp.]